MKGLVLVWVVAGSTVGAQRVGHSAGIEPSVSIDSLGSLLGAVSPLSDRLALFKGIPYAAPPVGDLRWRPPRPHGPWKSPRNATRYGSPCHQRVAWLEHTPSEDCLFLNIATPVDAIRKVSTRKHEAALPVMFFIHGGGYNSGASNHNRPDSLVLRSGSSAVVVTVNYRLNAFGFLGGLALKNRSGDGSFGNYGIQDQRLAMVWVRQYISAFGGDPHNVMIFGESAGGNSVVNHLTQPASFGLYKKALIESGDYCGNLEVAKAEDSLDLMLQLLGCGNIECLLQKPALEIADYVATLGEDIWGPVIDNVSIPDYPARLFLQGAFNKVPVLLGSNRDEAALVAAKKSSPVKPNATEQDLDQFMAMTFTHLDADALASVKELYKPSSYAYPANLGNYSLPWWQAVRMSTDGGDGWASALGHCVVRRIARALVEGGAPAVFVYFFAHPTQEVENDLNEGVPLAGTGVGSPLVPHASELVYAFGLREVLTSEGGEADLASTVAAYWTNFAHTGTPNSGWMSNLTDWPMYSRDADQVLRLDTPPAGVGVEKGLRRTACDFWDAHHRKPAIMQAGTSIVFA